MRNCIYDEYQRALASMFCKFFDKKIGSRATARSKVGVSVNEQLTEKLHKPVIKKIQKKKTWCKI